LIDFLLALATVTLAWWLSTGVVLLLNYRSATARRLAFAAMTAVSLGALVALPSVSQQHTAAGALSGFLCGLAIWAWLEMSYLMGYITGPRQAPCDPGCSGPRRFWLGLQASLYHEILVLAAILGSALLSAGGDNQVAAATCATLGLMRWSAKLNLFLGVRNYNQDWLPSHLAYLDSYTRRARMNALFPFSIIIASAVTVYLLQRALATADPFLRAGDLLVSALLALAVLEHWFLMLPFGESALWRWAQGHSARRVSEMEPRQQELGTLTTGKSH
jgi:putative photosynthetic complex assembly protein 2